MNRLALPLAGAVAAVALAACSGGAGPSTPLPSSAQVPQQSQLRAPFYPASSPVIVYVGFKHAAVTNPKYGKIAFYSPTSTGKTAPISVAVGSSVAFLNDDTTRHTASGLGSTGFPKSFDNKSGLKKVGTTINSGLTWASGSLNPGAQSPSFAVPTAGTYYFGCYYHYHVTPEMRDVIVAM